MSIFVALLVISFLIFIHELGHYAAARLVGVKVEEFSVGFPPKILQKKIGETIYSLGLLPFGGYVRLFGMNFEDENRNLPNNYAGKTISRKSLVILAGPLMNIILAMIVMPWGYYWENTRPAHLSQPARIFDVKSGGFAESKGFRPGDQIIRLNGQPIENWGALNSSISKSTADPLIFSLIRDGGAMQISVYQDQLRSISSLGWYPAISPEVGGVISESAAERAGILKGDRIFSIQGEPIEDFQQIPNVLGKYPNQTVAIGIQRQSERIFLDVLPSFDPQNNRYLLGISYPQESFQRGFGESIVIGFSQLVSLTGHIFEFLKNLVSGSVSSEEVGGPIAIVNMIGNASETGLSNLLFMIGFISFQLAILNLLPIPALDGGHLLLLIAEKIKGGELSINFRRRIQLFGACFLFSLMGVVVILDIFKFL